jgi:H+-transporting ATPase
MMPNEEKESREIIITPGLSQSEADDLIKQFVYNEVPDKKSYSLLRFLLKFWGITAWILEFVIILS